MANPQMVQRPVTQILSRNIRELARYWQGLCKGREFPAKRDVDPCEIKKLLPYLMLMEIEPEPLRVRFRLVGTEVVRMTGHDFTGRWLHETAFGPEGAHLEWCSRLLTSARTPVFGVGALSVIDDTVKVIECGMLPLSADGQAVTHALAIQDQTSLPAQELTAMMSPCQVERGTRRDRRFKTPRQLVL